MIPNEVREAVAKNNLRKTVAKSDVREYKERKILTRMAEAKLNGSQAVGFYYGAVVKESDLFHEEDHIKVLPVKILRKGEKVFSKYVVAFDVNKIELDSVIDIKVPKGKIGLFAGWHWWQVKEWCQKLGLKHINLVEEA